MEPSTQTIPRNRPALTHPTSLVGEVVGDLISQSTRIVPNFKFLYAAQDMIRKGGQIDDRKYLVEYIIQLAASLPNNSKLRGMLNANFIHSLWSNLQHPPLSYLGDEFKYRSANGADNNITYSRHSVMLGVAGSNYARNVAPASIPSQKLPDPSDIFDALFARGSSAKEHPTKVSSTLFHFATIITHDLFKTGRDITTSDTSSYLDLSPVYGNNEKEQKTVRTYTNGLLKKDVFADSRFLRQPPGVCALLVAFNRFHNHIVQELAITNENERFSIPSDVDESDAKAYDAALKKCDNDLFQTGRLITCGLYVNIVMNDYLRTILNLNRNPIRSDWKLDPREDFNNIFDREGTPRGIGNQVSVEFNVIYRWHSCISASDEAWVQGQMREILGEDADKDDLSMETLRVKLIEWAKGLPTEPEDWTFHNLKRNGEGAFSDTDLVGILQDATDNVAGAFGAQNIPRVLKVIEKQGILNGRKWGLASLNEFRKFFNLGPYASFTDVNPDAGVAAALEKLYGEPDNIELYPGLIAEATKKPMVPGSGLCPGFTTSYAILSDAVALVRGDRFYAVDFNPSNLTADGFEAVSGDYSVAGGGVMHKLLKTAFPGWYSTDSVYAKYPFTTPEGNLEIADKCLDFDKPGPLGKSKSNKVY